MLQLAAQLPNHWRLAKLALKRLSMDSKAPSCVGDISVAFTKNALNMFPLHSLERGI